MRYVKIVTPLFFFFYPYNTACAKQVPFETLEFKIEKTVQLEAGQVYKYILKLKAGEFASIKVRQKSVGIAYAVYAPGDSLMFTEDLNAIHQTEVINITAVKAGDYRIEIFWDYGRPQAGVYTITWDMLEPVGKSATLHANQLMNSWYSPDEAGAAVVVIQNGEIIFKGTRGLANMEYKIPITDSSAFELASCSKQFTGFAVAMLINKELLSFQDDVRKYLPELPDFGTKITIENLVYHTSGLRNWDAMSNAMGLMPEDVLTTGMIYKMICNTKELNFTPNERFAYNNTGYNLLALIVERVTGSKFDQWMDENIFRPMQMKGTTVRNDIKRIIQNRVYSYRKERDGYKVNPDNVSAIGSTSIYSTINDLALWINNFDAGKVGGKSVLKLLERKSKFNNGNDLGFYAFGNFFGNHKGIFKIEHLGLVSGFRTSIIRYPGQHLAVVYLSNDNNDAGFTHATSLADLFLQNEVNTPPGTVKFPDLKQALVRTMPDKDEKSPVDTKEFEGLYYAGEINGLYKVITENDGLKAISFKFDAIKLKWEKPDSFSSNFPVFSRTFEFVRDHNKVISGFKLTGGDREIVFIKLRQ